MTLKSTTTVKKNHTTMDISGVNARMFLSCGERIIITGVHACDTNTGVAREWVNTTRRFNTDKKTGQHPTRQFDVKMPKNETALQKWETSVNCNSYILTSLDMPNSNLPY